MGFGLRGRRNLDVVAWCEGCSKLWGPQEMGADGACPSCHRALAAPVPVTALEKAKGAPWHFKLVLVGVMGYLAYRIYWLIEWLPKHI